MNLVRALMNLVRALMHWSVAASCKVVLVIVAEWMVCEEGTQGIAPVIVAEWKVCEEGTPVMVMSVCLVIPV